MNDTPVTDANEFLMNDIGGMVVESRFVRPIEKELADLRRWKAEALAVLPDFQEIGREIGATIGSSIHDKILPELIRRREEIERLQKRVEEVKGIGQGFERDSRKFFEQRCLNLKRAEKAEEEIERLQRGLATTTVEGGEDSLYLIETRTTRLKKYNPKFGDDRMCECGHPYYRHFDWGDEDAGCSCKYCGCGDFLEDPDKTDEQQ